MKIYLTFDVEEWVLPEDYCINSNYNNNVVFAEKGCRKILQLLDKYGIQSTFFVTGYFAERNVSLIKEICSYGHEIASHGYKHFSLTKLDGKYLNDSIAKSSLILSKITKKNIKGFRAPNLAVDEEVLDIIQKNGFSYDSSLHPAIVPGYYYNFRHSLDTHYSGKNREILEIPISVIPYIRMPISWIWMRNLGNWVARYGVRANIKSRDVVLYFHTWEFVDIPNVKGVPFYVNRNTGNTFLQRLDRFIKEFKELEFGKLEEVAK